MTKTLHGKVHGRTIELDEDPGVAEGQEVEVQVRVISQTARAPGEGFLRTEGALADDPYYAGAYKHPNPPSLLTLIEQPLVALVQSPLCPRPRK
jgi:hypothetical protein